MDVCVCYHHGFILISKQKQSYLPQYTHKQSENNNSSKNGNENDPPRDDVLIRHSMLWINCY